jgi:hypothetical protein
VISGCNALFIFVRFLNQNSDVIWRNTICPKSTTPSGSIARFHASLIGRSADGG